MCLEVFRCFPQMYRWFGHFIVRYKLNRVNQRVNNEIISCIFKLHLEALYSQKYLIQYSILSIYLFLPLLQNMIFTTYSHIKSLRYYDENSKVAFSKFD